MEQPFFVKLRSLASYLDHGMDNILTKFEEKDKDLCAPEVMKALLDVKKSLDPMKDSVATEYDISRSCTREVDLLVQYGENLYKTQNRKIDEVENYLKQYGFKPQEAPAENLEPETEDTTLQPTDSLQSTPTTFKKPCSVNIKTPELEKAGLSEMTLKMIKAMEKKQERPQLSQPSKKMENLQEETLNGASSSTKRSGFDAKFGAWVKEDTETQHRPVLTTKALPNTTMSNSANLSKMPQIEDAGLSKAMMLRLEAMEMKQQQQQKQQHGTRYVDITKNMLNQRPIPSAFEHDGIICTPSAFGGHALDHTIFEGFASPVHPTFSVHKNNRGFQDDMSKGDTYLGYEPSPFDKTYNVQPSSQGTSVKIGAKENKSPEEPKLFSYGVGRGDTFPETEMKTEVIHKKLLFDDLPPSPKLYGTYSFNKK